MLGTYIIVWCSDRPSIFFHIIQNKSLRTKTRRRYFAAIIVAKIRLTILSRQVALLGKKLLLVGV